MCNLQGCHQPINVINVFLEVCMFRSLLYITYFFFFFIVSHELRKIEKTLMYCWDPRIGVSRTTAPCYLQAGLFERRHVGKAACCFLTCATNCSRTWWQEANISLCSCAENQKNPAGQSRPKSSQKPYLLSSSGLTPGGLVFPS